MWLAEMAGLKTAGEGHLRVFEDLVNRYEEPQRAYHVLRHVAEVWRVIEVAAPEDDARFILWLTTWFHDAIYDPKRGDNEEQSARLAEKVCPELGVPASTTAAIAAMTRATADHSLPPADATAALFLDADRAILGTPRDTYQTYVTQVRKEFAFVPMRHFRLGRSKYLWHWLRTKPLYHTEFARQRFERMARANLRWELAAWWLPWKSSPIRD